MEPTLNIGDRILVFKLAYDFTNPATGDVVVFKAPPSEHCGDPSVTDLVKRIVGCRGHDLVRRQHDLHQAARRGGRQAPHPELAALPALFTPITRQLVKPNHYFMMGDNHPASCDSQGLGSAAAVGHHREGRAQDLAALAVRHHLTVARSGALVD